MMREKLKQIRQEIIVEIGQDKYDQSGIKETHDQWEGSLDVEELND